MKKLLLEKIQDLKDKNLFRAPKGDWDEGYINFTSNDYLGLAKHPEVIAASVQAAEKYGVGATASRIAGGNHPLYDELEAKLSKAKACEAACVFGSGYLTNLGVITTLVGEGDLIIADKLSHNSLLEGAKHSGAKLVRFKHNCMEHLEEILKKQRGEYENCLIITEEIFSMDGDKAPLEKIAVLKEKYDAWFLVDGAHSIYDSTGHRPPTTDIYVGTLSKALGSYGGYICGSKTLIDYIKTSAKTLIYSTALPPSVVASALKALEVIEKERPYLRLLENIEYFNPPLTPPSGGRIVTGTPLPEGGVGGGFSHIVPFIIGDEEETLVLAEQLKQQKILVGAIRPPAVPKGTSRLRISFSASHSKSDVDNLINAIEQNISGKKKVS